MTSNANGDFSTPLPPPPHSQSRCQLLSVLSKDKLTGPNYLDWIRNLRITMRYVNKEYVLDKELIEHGDDATETEINAYDKHYDESTKFACLILATMSSEVQKSFENSVAYDINNQLLEMFQEQARQERFEVVKSLMACRLVEGASVCTHVQKMKLYIDRLENLGIEFPKELTIDMVLNSLTGSYQPFILN